MRRYRPYPEYKDSGVEWLGEIPKHWEIKQIKRLWASCEYGLSESLSGSGEVRVLTMAHIQDGRILLPEAGCLDGVPKAFLLDYDDLLFNRTNSRDLVGKVGIFKGNLEDLISFASYLVRIRARESVNPDFLNYLLNSTGTLSRARSLALLSVNQANLNPTRYGQIAVCLPSEENEQAEIVTALNRETSKLDALIQKKERLIELLQEKRTALITHAVTKGLDPDVPMKDSGVEWLGEIPAHWEVARLRYLTTVGNGSTPRRERSAYWLDGCNPWLTSGKINDELIQDASEFVTDAALRECHLPVVPAGSVLVAITGEGQTRGRAALLRIKATISQHLAFMTPRCERLDSVFLWRFFQSQYQWLRTESSGGGSTRAALTCDYLKSVAVAVPPISEQRQIAEFIEWSERKSEPLVAKVREAIDYLKEYRAALISAAVTGKIDVRQEAA